MSRELKAVSQNEGHGEFSFPKKNAPDSVKPITIKGPGEFIKKQSQISEIKRSNNDRNSRYTDIEKLLSTQKSRMEYFAKRGVDTVQCARLVDDIALDMNMLNDVLVYLGNAPDNEGVAEFKFKKLTADIKRLENLLSHENDKNERQKYAKRKSQLGQDLLDIIKQAEEVVKQPFYEKELEKLKAEYQKIYQKILDYKFSLAKEHSPNLEESPTIKEVLGKKKLGIERARAAYNERKETMKGEINEIIKQALNVLEKPDHKVALEILKLQYKEKYEKLRDYTPATAKNFTKELLDNKEFESATIFLEDDDLETVPRPPALPKLSQSTSPKQTGGFFNRWKDKIGRALLVVGAVFGLKGSPAPENTQPSLSDLDISTKTSPKNTIETSEASPFSVTPSFNAQPTNIARPVRDQEPESRPLQYSDSRNEIDTRTTPVSEPITPVERLKRIPKQTTQKEAAPKRFSSGFKFNEQAPKRIEIGFDQSALIDVAANKLKVVYPRMNTANFKRTLGHAIEATIEGAHTMQKRTQIEALLTDAFQEDGGDDILRAIERVFNNYNTNHIDIPSLKEHLKQALTPEPVEIGGEAGALLKIIQNARPNLTPDLEQKYRDAFKEIDPSIKKHLLKNGDKNENKAKIKTILDFIDKDMDPQEITRNFKEIYEEAFK